MIKITIIITLNKDHKVFILLINNNVKIIITLKLYNKKKMPQLVPFYFINQVTFAFILLVIMIYVFSKYILPRFVRLFISRIFISKL
jgi:F-type H+-transporting ATPase subunit 8